MLRNDRAGFGWVTIVLHWTIAVIILALLALGFIMRRVPIDPALQFSLYQWHKSLGFTALGLAAIRALWHVIELRPNRQQASAHLNSVPAASPISCSSGLLSRSRSPAGPSRRPRR